MINLCHVGSRLIILGLFVWAWEAPGQLRSSTHAAMSNRRSAGARGGGGGGEWGWSSWSSGQGRQEAPSNPSTPNAADIPYEVVMPGLTELQWKRDVVPLDLERLPLRR